MVGSLVATPNAQGYSCLPGRGTPGMLTPLPLREALGLLVAEGLADAEPFVGFHVADIPTPDHYRQLYDFRLVIETWAAAETARRRPPKTLAALKDSGEAMGDGT